MQGSPVVAQKRKRKEKTRKLLKSGKGNRDIHAGDRLSHTLFLRRQVIQPVPDPFPFIEALGFRERLAGLVVCAEAVVAGDSAC
jgi:hypothetical protein